MSSSREPPVEHGHAANVRGDTGLTIVAVGASAGGLDALREFFRSVPRHPRLAFVVITHLAPQHPSHMAELLGRATTMPVREAREGDRVEAGQVYVIQPDCLMSIRAGALRLEPAAPRPAVLRTIDHFMCALAEDQQEHCVGIVLSGADHDGTAGLKAIRAAGGMTMVQDPDTAQYPGMPRSAIATGVPDQVLPVERMGPALLEYVEHAPADLVPDEGAPAASPGEAPGTPARLEDILALIRERTGHDFHWYRSAVLLRRLRRRMGLRATRDASAYLALLRESDEELYALMRDFLINVTEFFREPDAWRVLEEEVVPRLLRDQDVAVRVWTPGCSTGEESYSIAMVLLEQAAAAQADARVSVFGTDVDTEALDQARAGSYPEAISVVVSPSRLTRFFDKVGDRYVVRKPLRDAVLFAPQNLVRDPPFSKCDLIICRNVLIYFEPDQQSRIFELFHFALNPGGILFLGTSESLGSHTDLFEPVSRSHRIFRRIGTTARLPRGFPGRWAGRGGFLTPVATPMGAAERDPGDVMREHLAQRAVAAAVLVNRDHRVLYLHGETGRYLQPAGEPRWDLPSLLREGLRTRVRAGLRQAITEERPVALEALTPRDDHFVRVAVQIEPLEDFARSGLLLVCLDESEAGLAPVESVPGQANAPQAIQVLEEELRRTRAALQATVREAENANTELRIAHEEAMAMNEELQSSNEELETSREEAQSLNEELSAVNSELEEKLADLERALNDVRNLVDSTRVATLFLDPELRIRRFTQDVTRLFSLIDTDQGRHLRDITSRVTDPNFYADTRAVLEGLESAETEVTTGQDEWFLRRILPYRTREGRVEGVVVTYTDITRLRHAAEEAKRLAAVLHDSNDAVIVHDAAGHILFWNRAAQHAYGYDQVAALGLNVDDLVPASHRGAARAMAERARQAGSVGPESAVRLARNGQILQVSVTLSALHDEDGHPYAVVSTERDITEQLRLESEVRFRAMADEIPTLLRIEDAKGRAQYLNRAWLEFTGESAQDALLANGWLKYIDPADLAAYLQGVRAARREGRRFEGDLRLRRADGRYRWMRSTEVTRRDEAGRFLGYVSVAVDIEERKLAEQALARESARKDEFLSMLAHELRNPLAPILNAAEIIGRVASAEPKVGWAAGVITRQTHQLTRLIDDLMDVARISSGKIVLSREPIELSVLLERARDATQPLFDARRQRFSVTFPSAPVYIEGDLVRLAQVIGNLLDNAAKYTPEGGAVTLAVSVSATHVEISVSDNGEGIAPELLPRVFDLFTQGDRTLAHARGGLGIGLTVAQRLVQMHGGSVEVHSAGPGCGSDFLVRLPVLHLPQRGAQEEAHSEPAVHANARRVLVVDDNPDAAQSTAMILELEGHDVRVTYGGAEALATAAHFLPDVVVLDIGLPGMSGYDVARQLRARQENAHVLLIAVTGYGQREDVLRARTAGFDHHLVKPVKREQLVSLIGAMRDT